jgi:hypothetical protein
MRRVIWLLGLVLILFASAVQAAPIVSCPGSATTTDREFTIDVTFELPPSDATVTCYDYDTGNLADDQFGPSWVLIDKEDDPEFLGDCEACFTITGLGETSGTFTILSTVWDTYSEVLLGFKVGEGQLDPDWAVFLLTGGVTEGEWLVTGQQSLSHADLWGGGEATEVPEPATLFLVGAGILGTTWKARRRA